MEQDRARWVEDAAAVRDADKPSHLRFLDFMIDSAARCGAALEPMCEAVEDYCALAGTDLTPAWCALYRGLFGARGGLLTHVRDAWLARHPEPLPADVPVDPGFVEFLKRDGGNLVLLWYLSSTETR